MRKQVVAVFVVFALNGAVLGSWAPRMPAIAHRLGAAPGALGLALLGGSVGMILAASVSGRVVEALGARRVIAGSGLLTALVLPALGLVPSVPLLGLVLVLLGATVGALDVAMNVAAVLVERDTGRGIMPVFHAGFSFGGLGGSLAAGLAASAHWSPGAHLGVAAVLTAAILVAVLRPLPVAAPKSERRKVENKPKVAPIRRPVLWLLAAVALCSAIAEGASSDWSALLMVTVHGTSQGAAAIAFSGFSLAMGIFRLAGAWLRDRFGPQRVLACGALVAGTGLIVAALIPTQWTAFAGFALAGAGLAAAFPLALSLAGDAGRRADGSGGERELAFVTTIAYSGFLAGPPLIGGIAQLSSFVAAFVVVGVIALLIAPAALGAIRSRQKNAAEANALPSSGVR